MPPVSQNTSSAKPSHGKGKEPLIVDEAAGAAVSSVVAVGVSTIHWGDRSRALHGVVRQRRGLNRS
jgi:hypothetical protein